GKPTFTVSIPRRSMRWRISIFSATGGSITEGLWSPSRSVSSSSMTCAGHAVVRGPARAQLKMRPFSSALSMPGFLVLFAGFGGSRKRLAELARSLQQLISAGVVTVRATDGRQVEQTAQFVNTLFQAAFEFPTCGLELALALVNHAQVIVSHHVFGCEGH